jgi:hypothetical protein
MMSGVPLETCCTLNKRWNNKFYYKVASCWLFLLIPSYHIFHKFLWYGLCNTTLLLTWTNPLQRLLNSLIRVYINLWSLRTPVIVHFRYLFTAVFNIVIYSKNIFLMYKINSIFIEAPLFNLKWWEMKEHFISLASFKGNRFLSFLGSRG